MKQNLHEIYCTNPAKACRLALRRTVKLPWKNRLEAIDKMLGNYGVEAIRGEWQNGYWCDIVAAYSNSGDTYDTTVLHVRGDNWNPAGQFFVGNVGDFVERNQKRFKIV